jgi:CheY-like chemotaxis protein
MSKKILLIDDEDLVRKSLGNFLSKQGYEVVACGDGEEALSRVRSEAVDLIVCDVRMPRLDGVETLKALRFFYKTHNHKPKPEILITGYADESSEREAYEMKVAEYLHKPLDMQDFLGRIQKHMVPALMGDKQ